ncbi:glutathione S-transferase family protein [Roseococcus sp. DSY-14]|uniref:glutathione S-transferase family protein n=1 Tax=Roseococcus sp. DSY-14 TaxID=3369650 RepID=UPI00387B2B87
MKLVGRMLSPFVRRVAATLNLYGMEWESWPLSTATDMAEIMRVNPVGRVPVLFLDGGEALVDSAAIIDHLDEVAGDAALTPRSGAERRQVMQAVAIGLGAADKTVAALYEGQRRPEALRWPEGLEKLLGQAAGGFRALDSMLDGRQHLALGRLTQADVTAAIAYDFACTVMPEWAAGLAPRLAELRDRLNADARVGGTRFTG